MDCWFTSRQMACGCSFTTSRKESSKVFVSRITSSSESESADCSERQAAKDRTVGCSKSICRSIFCKLGLDLIWEISRPKPPESTPRSSMKCESRFHSSTLNCGARHAAISSSKSGTPVLSKASQPSFLGASKFSSSKATTLRRSFPEALNFHASFSTIFTWLRT